MAPVTKLEYGNPYKLPAGRVLLPHVTGERIALAAENQVGRAFKPDQDARCADFVTCMLLDGGVALKQGGFRPAVFAREFADMGAREIHPEKLVRGDVLAFKNTWRASKDEKDYTHVAVYSGQGLMIHRPTSRADYFPGCKPGEVIMELLEAYLTRKRGRFHATLECGYRFW